jgi:hypothetical protein
MATTYKSPAQLEPAAQTLSTLYTVPANTQAVISNIHACNLGSTSASIRVAVRPDGASIADQHYLFFGLMITANDTVEFGHGITMDAADVLSVWSSSGSVSFNLSYAEVTP